jgi:uncharacterized protein (DUF362 family)
MHQDRRTFLRNALAMGGGAFLGFSNKSGLPQSLPSNSSSTQTLPKSSVVLTQRSDLRTGSGLLSGDSVLKLLDTAVENFAQTKTQLAWGKIFKPDDVVALKVNCLAGKGLSTSIELTNAVIERLLGAGVKRNNIIVWDRLNSDLERAGYKIYSGRSNFRCYGNDHAGYTDELYEHGSVCSLLSRIACEQCTAMINMPILKDHGIVGFSGALKNNFGAIHNPNKYHDSVGDPYVADVNMLPAIHQKTRLILCDALTPQYEGGPPFMPQWTWRYDSLLVATDAVALDHVGWQIIEEKRKEKGLPTLKDAGREPTYIATAADARHRLGTNDPKKIQLIKA